MSMRRLIKRLEEGSESPKDKVISALNDIADYLDGASYYSRDDQYNGHYAILIVPTWSYEDVVAELKSRGVWGFIDQRRLADTIAAGGPAEFVYDFSGAV